MWNCCLFDMFLLFPHFENFLLRNIFGVEISSTLIEADTEGFELIICVKYINKKSISFLFIFQFYILYLIIFKNNKLDK